jgi:hypothetical protein
MATLKKFRIATIWGFAKAKDGWTCFAREKIITKVYS